MIISLLAFALLAQDPAPTADHPHHDPERFLTDREGALVLDLPSEEGSFSFAVFGDRTGGPDAGVAILAEAVDEVNVIGPDLVMTVGDLIQGYNRAEQWLEQAAEFKGIMGKLDMPWFPVAGNHDIYWRGANRPAEEHEGRYEMIFGPLWYAFKHKDCWFVVLYTDEADPATGERNFNKAASQKMSPEQLAWLKQTLQHTAQAKHVFVFLHHPRWLGGKYGDDWQRVHKVLAAAGNVSAVFAGHIHQMKYSGERDGIEYFALATVGGHQIGDVAEAGFLHHYDLVTVRDDGISIASLPVGTVTDPRKITVQLSAEIRNLQDRWRPAVLGQIAIAEDGSVRQDLRVRVDNPVTQALEVTLTGTSTDPRWWFTPDHTHFVLQPGESREVQLRVHRWSDPIDAATALPEILLQADYLGEGVRIPLPARSLAIETTPPPLSPFGQMVPGVLRLDGQNDFIAIAPEQIDLPDGPFTVEFKMRADAFRGRQGVFNRTENSEWGWFLNDGTPEFMIHFKDLGYVQVAGPKASLPTNEWVHLAGVYDGSEIRVYQDGKLVARKAAQGSRTSNQLPLIIGADVNKSGAATDHFAGRLDELRISQGARYTGEQFDVPSRHRTDAETILLLHCDRPFGPWLFDSSKHARHPQLRNGARVTPIAD